MLVHKVRVTGGMAPNKRREQAHRQAWDPKEEQHSEKKSSKERERERQLWAKLRAAGVGLPAKAAG